jgi:hypothetical protein
MRFATRSGRPCRSAIGCAALCLFSIPACTLDNRTLRVSADGGFDSGEDPQNQYTGSGVRLVDAAVVHYNDPRQGISYGDSSAASDLLDAGTCTHVNQLGELDCTDTLVRNADFNHSIVGWLPFGGGELRWVNFDSQGSKSSGSLAVLNAETGAYDGSIGGAASQCVPLKAGVGYNAVVSMYIKSGQTSGFAQVLLFQWDQPDCKGMVLNATAVVQTDTTDMWETGGAGTMALPQAKSLSLELNVQKPFRSGALEALFDAIRLTAATSSSIEE